MEEARWKISCHQEAALGATDGGKEEVEEENTEGGGSPHIGGKIGGWLGGYRIG